MEREAGVLLAISSLPSQEGIGTLGAGAYAFADFLAEAGFRVWQVLPLTPTREGNSPYSSICASALNPLFIDLFDLVKRGLLRAEEISVSTAEQVDYAAVTREKNRLLRLAFSRFSTEDPDFLAFEKEGKYWEYAAFSTLSEHFGGLPFTEWKEGLNHYDPQRVAKLVDQERERYLYHLFTQYLFDKQWRTLKSYANARGVRIFGDMPIYVAMNSAEVYFHPEMFQMGEDLRPKKVAGVPPDYFNSEGQLWGNPLYDWERMSRDGFRWWRDRIKRELSRYDILRIDHFRGLDRYYAIEADAKDAKHGVWLEGPGAALFEGMTDLPIVAEDLGYIDESLRAMLEKVNFPGMKVYEFGLNGDPWSEHKPANYKENVVGYTGTHDNMPFRGYLDSLEGRDLVISTRDILVQATVLNVPLAESIDLAKEVGAGEAPDLAERKKIAYLESLPDSAFLGQSAKILTETATMTLFRSKARLAIVPMQDLLALGEKSRMNTPALVSEENWSWRLSAAFFKNPPSAKWKAILIDAKRCNEE